MTAAPRRIWLCADDYGISAGVNRAICDLIARGRLNATSVMMVGAAIDAGAVSALQQAMAESPRCAIGLHVTLTAPFHPLTTGFRPLDHGRFLPLSAMLRLSVLRRLDREMIRQEVKTQVAAFTALIGRTPDYLDGHQHVHLFPQVRDAVLDALVSTAPQAWIRQCGRPAPLKARLASPKAVLLDLLSIALRKRARQRGIACNTAFDGAYDFTREAAFDGLMRAFLAGMPDGGLVMCHPGFVDDTLRALDPFTDQREREYSFLSSDDLPHVLDQAGVTLT